MTLIKKEFVCLLNIILAQILLCPLSASALSSGDIHPYKMDDPLRSLQQCVRQVPPAAEWNPLASLAFSEPFEDLESISANGGEYNGITLAPGKAGNGILVDGTGTLTFPTQNNLLAVKGTIDFWIKPQWSGVEPQTHYFFHWQNGETNFRIFNYYSPSSGKNYFVFRYDDQKGNQREASSHRYEPNHLMQWKADEWHHIQVFWDLTANAEGRAYMGYILDGDYDKGRMHTFTWQGVDPIPPVFSIGSNHHGTLQAHAIIDELQIYTESFMGPESIVDGYLAVTKNDGAWQHHETIHNAPLDAPQLSESVLPGKEVLFYQKHPFEPVYDGTVPDPADIKTDLYFQSAREEYETLFLNVYSRKELVDVEVRLTDFVHENGESLISLQDVDIRVVKNWFQAGIGPTKTLMPRYLPELLLKDDRIPLENLAWDHENLPSQPLTQYAQTTIPASTSKQIALIVNIPGDQAPGTYTAQLSLFPGNGAPAAVNVHLEVLPFTLLRTQKDYILYHRGRIAAEGPDLVGADRYRKQIADIARHGFNGLTVYPDDLDVQRAKLQIIHDLGLKGNVVSLDYREEVAKLMAGFGVDAWIYGIDEPNDPDRIKTHIQKSINIHQWGALVTTAIKKEWSERLKNPQDEVYADFPEGTLEPLDLANLSVYTKGSPDYFHDLINGGAAKTAYETYYWQMMDEDPRVNRFLAGYFLWNTGMDGVFPYVYQHVNFNPYDDFDIWSPAAPDYRDHLVTYPSREGPIPTIQWEALREGIDDVRYLETWQYYVNIAEAIDPDLAQSSKRVINALLDGYKDYFQMRAISIAQFAMDRKIVSQEILKLRFILSPSPPTGLVVD